MKSDKTMKTTVTFPANLLKALHAYMVENDISLHKQSEIVAVALREYLEKNWDKSIPNDDAKITFEVSIKSE